MSNLISENAIILGETIKIAITADSLDGVNLTDYDWEVEFYSQPKRRLRLQKAHCNLSAANQYIAVVDTNILGSGPYITVVLNAKIPDADCPTGFRMVPAAYRIPNSEIIKA